MYHTKDNSPAYRLRKNLIVLQIDCWHTVTTTYHMHQLTIVQGQIPLRKQKLIIINTSSFLLIWYNENE